MLHPNASRIQLSLSAGSPTECCRPRSPAATGQGTTAAAEQTTAGNPLLAHPHQRRNLLLLHSFPLYLSTTRASCSTVGASNSRRNGSSTANTSLKRATTCVASSECPPNSKKLLLSMPTSLHLSTCSQIPHSNSSLCVRARWIFLSGLRRIPAQVAPAVSRSTFPLAFTGNLSTNT